MSRKLLLCLVLIAVIGIASVLVLLALVRRASAGKLYSSTAEIPHRRVGLLLGCKKQLGDGVPNPFFENRLRAATELFKAGKIDYIIVSGDNHTRGYDEATDMKGALLHQGVPADHIYSDCAGFRTLDSILRARDIFGINQMTIISQRFHNQRAIFLASHNGLGAIGFNAQDADLGDVSGTHRREKLADIKAVLDVYLLRTKPHFLGSTVTLGADPPTTCSGEQ